ncbi:mannosyl-oligosaccharide glucosidase-like [Lytechinus variegatus]|uniref:mannosyl-oligosaccharide glucosidase-like n=1 Tax=Lytechinus variegatus TaxID=7654 RepID=UPI001BB203BE|nr:mannosyl-oligosaccharide glucosidase-like [Lytechinus variegatus]
MSIIFQILKITYRSGKNLANRVAFKHLIKMPKQRKQAGVSPRSRFTDGVGGARSRETKHAKLGNGAQSRKAKDEAAQSSSKFIMFLLTSLMISIPLMIMWYQHVLRSAVKTPLSAPLTIASDASSAAKSPGRFWGTYRPGVYFGLKTRSPKSPVVGLMWFRQPTSPSQNPDLKFRHTCEQGDGLDKYGWIEHDGVNFGIQDIFDGPFQIKTAFAKSGGGLQGGDWSASISVRYKDGVDTTKEKKTLSLMFYFALDGQGSIEPILDGNQLLGIKGTTEELGKFVLRFPQPTKVRMNNYLVSYTPGLHAIKDLVMRRLKYHELKKKIQLLGLVGNDQQTIAASPDKMANIIVYQVTVEPPYIMDVVFESGSKADREKELAGSELTSLVQSFSNNFNQRFEEKFGLIEKGYAPDEVAFAKATMSNMIGGIGYFYGSSVVQSKHNTEPVAYWTAPLYTAVPSRSFFPRGFLWDEGFHNLLISKWDPYISVDIIGHWLDLMNADGWIPREQILDSEARSKVPAEFVVQHDTNANPPTFFLPLQSILRDGSSVIPKKEFTSFLKHIYPRLAKWFQWFNTTQYGPVPTSYRWKGRDSKTNRELNPKTLTSGFDDYPRASHPSSEERHIDLRCWMALASSVMVEIGKTIGLPYDQYEHTLHVLTNNALLEKLHWSPKAKMFSDFGNHTARVLLERPHPPPRQPGQQPVQMEMVRVVKSKFGPTNKYVNSFGYVSLFPFLLHILDPNSDKLGKTLTDMKNPDMLWTNYGLRSLSKSDPLYMKHNTEHDPPYWRGAVWINVNYLALRALHHYANVPGPYAAQAKEIYSELRANVVSNIIKQYNRSGYVWENYNDITGKGQGCHPFTGWSALVVLMMSESY